MTQFLVFDMSTGEYFSGNVGAQDVGLQQAGPGQSLVWMEHEFNPRTERFDPETGEIVPLVMPTASLVNEARTQLIKNATLQFAKQVTKGFVFNSINYQCDDYSRSNIAGAVLRALTAVADPPSWPEDGYPWIATDNSTQVFAEPADLIAFGQAAEVRYRTLVFAFRDIKDNIIALTTLEDCNSFDVTQGWPE